MWFSTGRRLSITGVEVGEGVDGGSISAEVAAIVGDESGKTCVEGIDSTGFGIVVGISSGGVELHPTNPRSRRVKKGEKYLCIRPVER